MGFLDFFKTVDVWVDKHTDLMWQLDIENKNFSWNEANEYVIQKNLAQYAGFDDWRLATIEELENVYRYKNLDIAWKYKKKGINVNDFSQAFYWSSNLLEERKNKIIDSDSLVDIDMKNKAWNVCAMNAMAGFDDITDKQRVRMVRNN